MRILVVGAGATGGYFGGRLAAAGRDVTFLVRPARAQKLRADGLRIVSPHGDLTLTPQLVTAGNITGPFDLVLLTVKAFSLAQALDDIAPAVGPDTMVMPVLNGMRHVDTLIARFGAHPVIGGVCRIAAMLDDQGRIIQLAKFHSLSYGELNGQPSARTAQLDAAMQGAGFEAALSPVIEREMWEKWILLAALGGITCLLRGTIGEIEAAPGGADMSRAILAECIAVATAAGQTPSAPFVETAQATLTAKGSPLTSSMYRDLNGGQAVEADQILGDLIARAAGFGVATPLLAAAFAQLSIYQRRRAAAG